MDKQNLPAVAPTAELLSEMESLVVLGGDGGIGGTTYAAGLCSPNLTTACTNFTTFCANTTFTCGTTFYISGCSTTDNCPVTYAHCQGAYCSNCVSGCGN